MKSSIIHQTVALLASLALIVTLTLAFMGKIAMLVFWLVAIVCLALVYLLKKE